MRARMVTYKHVHPSVVGPRVTGLFAALGLILVVWAIHALHQVHVKVW